MSKYLTPNPDPLSCRECGQTLHLGPPSMHVQEIRPQDADLCFTVDGKESLRLEVDGHIWPSGSKSPDAKLEILKD